MKKFFMLLAVLGMTQFTFAGKKSVDTSKSKINWTGTKVTGKHTGTLNFKSGIVTLDDQGVLVGAQFTVDMNSITVTDLSGEWKQKLEGHLKNDDFFSVPTYSTAQLKLKKVLSKSGSTYEVLADLTIKKVTQPVKFKVDLEGKKQVVAKGSVTFDRTKFGVKYGSGSFFKGLGDKMIHDEIKFDFNVVAK